MIVIFVIIIKLVINIFFFLYLGNVGSNGIFFVLGFVIIVFDCGINLVLVDINILFNFVRIFVVDL